MQYERSKKNDAPFPDFNGFHKSALHALGWRIIDGGRGGAGFNACYPYQTQPLEGSCWMDCAKRILFKYIR